MRAGRWPNPANLSTSADSRRQSVDVRAFATIHLDSKSYASRRSATASGDHGRLAMTRVVAERRKRQIHPAAGWVR
jgi:hypothetical protein